MHICFQTHWFLSPSSTRVTWVVSLICLVVGRLFAEIMWDRLTLIIHGLAWVFSQGAWASMAKNELKNGKLKIYITFIESIHQWKRAIKKQTNNLVIYMQKRAKTFKLHFIKKNMEWHMTHVRDYPLLDKIPFYVLFGLLVFVLIYYCNIGTGLFFSV